MNQIWTIIICAFALTSCTDNQSTTNLQVGLPTPECHIVYDAASGDTVLFIYRVDNWESQKSSDGPALATRGKVNDISLVDSIIALYQEKEIQDFKKNCSKIASVKFYATAGMRLAEQDETPRAIKDLSDLWDRLRTKLKAQYINIPLEAKTMTGFEEGVFAWLAVHDDVNSTYFGIVEMGGASSQVFFPCSKCNGAKKVYVDDGKNPMFFYGHSFLGLGGDELPMSLVDPIPPACVWGAKKPALCRTKLDEFFKLGIKDPYNKTLNSSAVSVPIKEREALSTWYLLGSPLVNMDKNNKSDVGNCCQNTGAKDLCFAGTASCFLAVYKEEYLKALGIALPKNSNTVIQKKYKWALGAAICAKNNCLRDVDLTKLCHWQDKSKCLPVLPTKK